MSLEKLYQGLTEDGSYTKSFAEFEMQMKDNNYRQNLYNGLFADKLYTKSFDEFNQQYSGNSQGPTNSANVGQNTSAQPSPNANTMGSNAAAGSSVLLDGESIPWLKDDKGWYQESMVHAGGKKYLNPGQTKKVELLNKKASTSTGSNALIPVVPPGTFATKSEIPEPIEGDDFKLYDDLEYDGTMYKKYKDGWYYYTGTEYKKANQSWVKQNLFSQQEVDLRNQKQLEKDLDKGEKLVIKSEVKKDIVRESGQKKLDDFRDHRKALKRAVDKQRKGLELTEEEQTALNNRDKEEELFKLTPEENTQLSKEDVEETRYDATQYYLDETTNTLETDYGKWIENPDYVEGSDLPERIFVPGNFKQLEGQDLFLQMLDPAVAETTGQDSIGVQGEFVDNPDYDPNKPESDFNKKQIFVQSNKEDEEKYFEFEDQVQHVLDNLSIRKYAEEKGLDPKSLTITDVPFDQRLTPKDMGENENIYNAVIKQSSLITDSVRESISYEQSRVLVKTFEQNYDDEGGILNLGEFFDNVKNDEIEKVAAQKVAEFKPVAEALNKSLTSVVADAEELKKQIELDFEYISNIENDPGPLAKKIQENIENDVYKTQEELDDDIAEYEKSFEEYSKVFNRYRNNTLEFEGKSKTINQAVTTAEALAKDFEDYALIEEKARAYYGGWYNSFGTAVASTLEFVNGIDEWTYRHLQLIDTKDMQPGVMKSLLEKVKSQGIVDHVIDLSPGVIAANGLLPQEYEIGKGRMFGDGVETYTTGLRGRLYDKRFNNTATETWYSMLEMTPQIMMSMAGMPAFVTMPAMMVSSAGRNFKDLEMQGLTGMDLYMTANFNGAMEGITDYFVSRMAGKALGSWNDPASNYVKQSLKGYLKNVLKTGAYSLKEGTEEFFAEGSSQFAQNVWSKYYLNEDTNVWEGVYDAGKMGFNVSLGFRTFGPIGKSILNPFTASNVNNRLVEISGRIDDINLSLKQPNLNEKQRAKFETEMTNLVNESTKLRLESIKDIASFDETDKNRLVEIEVEMHNNNKQIKETINDQNLDDGQKSSMLESLKNSNEALLKEKDKTISKYNDLTRAEKDRKYNEDMEGVRAYKEALDKNGVVELDVKEGTTQDVENVFALEETSGAVNIDGLENYSMELKGTLQGMQELINDPNTPADVKADAEAFLAENQSVQAESDFANAVSIIKGNARSYGSMMPKFDSNGNVTGFQLMINTETALRDGYLNTGSHELVHVAWWNTLKGDPIARAKLGDAITRLIDNGDIEFKDDKAAAKWKSRVDGYQLDQKGEEALTVITEMVRDGDATLNSASLQVLKDNAQSFAKDKMGRDIALFSGDVNTDADILAFISDFNESVQNNKPSPAILRMIEKGANGKMFEDARSPQERSDQRNFSQAVDLAEQDNPDLKDTFDKFTKNDDGTSKHTDQKSFENSPDYYAAYLEIVEGRALDGLIQQGMTGKGLPPEALRKFTRDVKEEIGRRYLPRVDKKTGKVIPGYRVSNNSLFGWLTGVAGGRGKSIIYRARGDVMNQYKAEQQANTVSMDKKTDEGGSLADIVADAKDSRLEALENENLAPGRKEAIQEVENDIRVKDALQFDDNVSNAVSEVVTDANVDITDLTYKGVKNLLAGVDKITRKDKSGNVIIDKKTGEPKLFNPTKSADATPTGPLYGALEAISSEFGVDPLRILANQDLDATQRQAAQEYILQKSINEDGSFNDILFQILPEGETRSGEATGVANTKLGDLYTRGERLKVAEGATKELGQKLEQKKQASVDKDNFLGMFGINPDGTFQSGKANDGAIKALITQVTQATVNQELRENTYRNGTSNDAIRAKLADGKSERMFSANNQSQATLEADYETLINSIAEADDGVSDFTKDQLESIVRKTYDMPKGNKGFVNTIVKQLLPEVNRFQEMKREFEGTDTFDLTMTGFIAGRVFLAEDVSNDLDLKKNLGLDTNPGNEFNNKESLQVLRTHVKDVASNLVTELGFVDAARSLLTSGKNAFIGAGKAGSNQFIPKSPGSTEMIPNPEYDGTEGNRYKIGVRNPDYFAMVNDAPIKLTKAQLDAGLTPYDPSDPQKRWVREAKGQGNIEVWNGKSWQIENITELSESVDAVVKDRDGKTRKQNAIKEQQFAKKVLDSAWQKVLKGDMTKAQFGALIMNLGSSMDAPLRKAAPCLTLQKGLDKIKEWGKSVGLKNSQSTRFEHAESKADINKRIVDSYAKNNELNIDEVFDGYQVIAMSGLWDKAQTNADFATKSPQTGYRFNNWATLNEFAKLVKKYGPDAMVNLTGFESIDPDGNPDIELKSQQAADIVRERMFSNVTPDGNLVSDITEVIAKPERMLSKYVDVFGGRGRLDVSTEAGKKILKEINNIPTVSSSEAGRVTKSESSKGVKPRGASIFDFDETLIDKGTNTIVATKGDDVVEISSEDWPIKGPDLQKAGYDFNFDDFINVKGGVKGPLFQKFLNRIKKYGIDNNFILTARPAEAAPAIQAWLKSQGVDIPIENITGLGNSTGEAKGLWVAQKFAEGYNDMYFVDDALPNVEAVRDVMDQLDIKGKSVQALRQFSKEFDFDQEFESSMKDFEQDLDLDVILEETKGVDRNKKFSRAKAKRRGKGKGIFKLFLPPSAEDFKGLLYPLMGKGKKGEAHQKFFKQKLMDPYAKGMRAIHSIQQKAAYDLKQLKRTYKDIGRKLNKDVPGLEFTHDQTIRVYNWAKQGFAIPGLSIADQAAMIEYVNNNPEMKQYADAIDQINKSAGGVTDPDSAWLAANTRMDMMDIVNSQRDNLMAEFNANSEIIFNEENMNKLEAVYGSNYVEALRDSLFRMRKGNNRLEGTGRLTNLFNNWVNGSIGATMFFNARSATLQTLSTVNFINWSDNNPIKVAKTLANPKQYSADFIELFNSDFLKQRRSGLTQDLNAAEMSEAIKGAKNPIRAAVGYLLQKGFLPTQMADSFAIASGGASFYRNRVNTLMDQGMSKADAETQAFQDFQEIAEETQQSARPDKISQQQASPMGRLILAFQNTPMQYNRLIKRSVQDLVNGRGDAKSHVSRIAYYGAIQNAIFYSLQQALFAVVGGDDEEEEDDEKKQKKKENAYFRVGNGMIDSLLRGSGFGGAAISTLKNMVLEFMEQEEKRSPDHAYTLIEMLNLSPPIGIKARKLYSATQTWEFDRDVIQEMNKTDLDNPLYDAAFSAIEATTNVPLARLSSKIDNIREALNADNAAIERVALLLGWSTWNFGIENQAVLDSEARIKEIKKIKKQEKKIQKQKEIEEAEEVVIQENIEKQKEEKKENKEVKCAAVNKSGKRCNNVALPGNSFCTVHDKVEQQEEEVQCTKIKKDGKRCKMKTKNKSKLCYYHD